jgi:hypothetical protein
VLVQTVATSVVNPLLNKAELTINGTLSTVNSTVDSVLVTVTPVASTVLGPLPISIDPSLPVSGQPTLPGLAPTPTTPPGELGPAPVATVSDDAASTPEAGLDASGSDSGPTPAGGATSMTAASAAPTSSASPRSAPQRPSAPVQPTPAGPTPDGVVGSSAGSSTSSRGGQPNLSAAAVDSTQTSARTSWAAKVSTAAQLPVGPVFELSVSPD